MRHHPSNHRYETGDLDRGDARRAVHRPTARGVATTAGAAALTACLLVATPPLAIAQTTDPADPESARSAQTQSERTQEDDSREERAQIHFADLGGIEDWRALGSDRILIEGRNGRWYEATFFGTCPGVQFVSTLGFITEPTGELDRFSSVLVDGERCWFRTFRRVDPEALPDDRGSEEGSE